MSSAWQVLHSNSVHSNKSLLATFLYELSWTWTSFCIIPSSNSTASQPDFLDTRDQSQSASCQRRVCSVSSVCLDWFSVRDKHYRLDSVHPLRFIGLTVLEAGRPQSFAPAPRLLGFFCCRCPHRPVRRQRREGFQRGCGLDSALAVVALTHSWELCPHLRLDPTL